MSKTTIVALVIGLVIGACGGVLLKNDTAILGSSVGPDSYDTQYFNEGFVSGQVTVSATTATLKDTDFGKTVILSAASGTTVTLPAVKKGGWLRFVIGSAFDTANVILDSKEGDNIDGTVVVAGAVVDCDAEDQLNFVNDGENLGDFVELVSDGTSWYIGASGALTASKLTCTDPS
jgi:glycerate-2-kinase